MSRFNKDPDRAYDEWVDNEVEKQLSLEEMDELIKAYKIERDQYDEMKKKASEQYKKVEVLESRIMKTLDAAGKKSYKVDGLGTFGIVQKQTVTTPKTIEAKRELFEYVRKEYGDDVLDSLLSIHSGTLNSFYNQEFEKSESKELFHIPGLEAPVMRLEPRFTKQK